MAVWQKQDRVNKAWMKGLKRLEDHIDADLARFYLNYGV